METPGCSAQASLLHQNIDQDALDGDSHQAHGTSSMGVRQRLGEKCVPELVKSGRLHRDCKKNALACTVSHHKFVASPTKAIFLSRVEEVPSVVNHSIKLCSISFDSLAVDQSDLLVECRGHGEHPGPGRGN